MPLQLEVISEHKELLGDDYVREFYAHGGTIGRSLDNDWILPDADHYISDLGDHPSAVSGTQPYMVTELMGGGDVEGIVEDAPDHRLPLEQAISIAVETCRGLDFAHSKGIVHRDLKPGNVWLTSDGVAKIGDFGLAVAIDRSRLTSAPRRRRRNR